METIIGGAGSFPRANEDQSDFRQLTMLRSESIANHLPENRSSSSIVQHSREIVPMPVELGRRCEVLVSVLGSAAHGAFG